MQQPNYASAALVLIKVASVAEAALVGWRGWPAGANGCLVGGAGLTHIFAWLAAHEP
jgi:hypothetical protein